jgi:fimbrial isopeptide formation D2 family protein/LPXTG-motif cell wall-anchored protein
MKRTISIFLTAILLLTLAGTALAADPPYSINVQNSNSQISIDGKTFSAYKIFDVTYSAGPDSSYHYTVDADFTGFTYDGRSGSALLDWLGTVADNSAALDDFAAAALKYAADRSITADGTGTASGQAATIGLSDAGYYLVAGSAKDQNNNDVVAACSLTTTDPSAEVHVKADAPSLSKSIVGGDHEKSTAQDIGDTVRFQLTSKVPNMTGYNGYTFIVTDTMSDGLTFNNDVAITVGGAAVPAEKYTVTATSNGFTLDFEKIIDYRADHGDPIVITYSATLNDNALASDSEKNTASLEYSNDPNNDPGDGDPTAPDYDPSTAETPDSTVYVYDFDLVVDKYTVKNGTHTPLSGAKFVLYKVVGGNHHYYLDEVGNDVTWVEVIPGAGQTELEAVQAKVASHAITEVVTDAEGKASFPGLDSGTYHLLETEAPDGYNRLTDAEAVEITITCDTDGNVMSTSAQSTNDGQYSQTAGVENHSGLQLPETGGIGTRIFYMLGGVLVCGAIVLLFTRKKMSAGRED